MPLIAVAADKTTSSLFWPYIFSTAAPVSMQKTLVWYAPNEAPEGGSPSCRARFLLRCGNPQQLQFLVVARLCQPFTFARFHPGLALRLWRRRVRRHSVAPPCGRRVGRGARAGRSDPEHRRRSTKKVHDFSWRRRSHPSSKSTRSRTLSRPS